MPAASSEHGPYVPFFWMMFPWAALPFFAGGSLIGQVASMATCLAAGFSIKRAGWDDRQQIDRFWWMVGGVMVANGLIQLVAIGSGVIALMYVAIAEILSLAVVAWFGASVRLGEEARCPACAYEAPTGPADTWPARCPECNADWIARVQVGRPLIPPSWRSVGVGAAVVGVVGFFIVSDLASSYSFNRRLATNRSSEAIIAAVLERDDPGRVLEDELFSRALTTPQAASLAEGLMTRRSLLSFVASGWLESYLSAGSVPSELEDSFMDRMMAVEVGSPTRCVTGALHEIRVRRHDDVLLAGFPVFAEVTRVRLDGHEEVVEAVRIFGPDALSVTSFSFNEPGSHRVEIEYRVCALRSTAGSGTGDLPDREIRPVDGDPEIRSSCISALAPSSTTCR